MGKIRPYMKKPYDGPHVPKNSNDPVRMYARMRSSGKSRSLCLVVLKYRADNTYRCSCFDNVFRRRNCKHIQELRKAEKRCKALRR